MNDLSCGATDYNHPFLHKLAQVAITQVVVGSGVMLPHESHNLQIKRHEGSGGREICPFLCNESSIPDLAERRIED